MSSADWTSISNGSGAFAIVADGTAPSGPDVMQITAGGQHFQNITGGPFKNSAINCWNKQVTANSNTLSLILRSQNATFSAAPATYFRANINAQDPVNVGITISAIVAGVATTIVNTSLASVNGNPVATWQRFEFASLNSGTDMLLRVSQWNGANFIPMVDAAAPIGTFPTLDATGLCRFGGTINSGGPLSIDDVNYYSLT